MAAGDILIPWKIGTGNIVLRVSGSSVSVSSDSTNVDDRTQVVTFQTTTGGVKAYLSVLQKGEGTPTLPPTPAPLVIEIYRTGDSQPTTYDYIWVDVENYVHVVPNMGMKCKIRFAISSYLYDPTVADGMYYVSGAISGDGSYDGDKPAEIIFDSAGVIIDVYTTDYRHYRILLGLGKSRGINSNGSNSIEGLIDSLDV